MARFNSKYCKLTIIQCYAPTNDSEDGVKEDGYEQLQAEVTTVPQHDMLPVMGDMNAKIGSYNNDRERDMGSQGCGTINNNGERPVNLCLNNNCVIGWIIFQHKDIHKLTWTSPDGKTVNQIDHVVINNKWRRSLKEMHTCRGADTGCNHYLVMSRLKLCLRKAPAKKNRPMRYNTPRLKEDEVLKAFVVEIKNQFQLLSTEEIDHPQVEGKWKQIKDVYCSTIKNTLGYLRSIDKTWLSNDTWRRIEERKTIKSNILNTKSKRIQERLQLEYSIKDKEIKKSARHDKRAHVDNIAMKVETDADRGEMSTAYRLTKQLYRHTKASVSIVKDKEGNPLTTEETQAKRWVEHFSEVLNRESVTITADPTTPIDDLDIATGVPTLQEVTQTIQQMKAGKAPRSDNICTEMLKTDIHFAGRVFTDLFRDIWTNDVIPNDWNKGLIGKLPKKRDLQHCDNWRGITLLSVTKQDILQSFAKQNRRGY